jgi:exodeoxyribonuclease V alpha subunit
MESTEESETLRGVLKRVRFSNESGSFSVSELEVENRAMPVTLVGNILATRPGETVEVNGVWQNDRRYGRQFRIQRIYSVPPTNREGIRRYLSSGMIEGIGPVLAGRIVEHFGAETLDVIDEDPTRIREVDGIGARRAESIAAAWDEQREIRTIMVFLQSHGISQSHATKIYETYGERAIDIIQNNPYRLAEDIWGIGFKTADAIASEAGIRRDAMTRLRAGVVHVLREAHGDGHMYLPLPELLARASELLGVARDALGAAIEKLKYEDKIAVEPAGATLDTPAVYRGGAYRTEVDAARHLARLLEGGGLLPAADLDVELERAEERMGIELADAQRRAALAPWSDKLVVLTGGPGTGKTTIVRAVCALGEHLGRRLALAAPTGRAARRLAEATGRPAQTVHRLLEYSFKEGGFQRDEERPLDVDLLIVD